MKTSIVKVKPIDPNLGMYMAIPLAHVHASTPSLELGKEEEGGGLYRVLDGGRYCSSSPCVVGAPRTKP